MASLTMYTCTLLFMLGTIQFAGLEEAGHEETLLQKCEGDHRSMPPDVPCELESKTIVNGRNAIRQTDIRMEVGQLMEVLNNKKNLEIRTPYETIAKGMDIEEVENTRNFIDRWYITIAPAMDDDLRNVVFLRYSLFVRNVTFIDESIFRLIFKTETFSFSTSEAHWFTVKRQDSAGPDSTNSTGPVTPTAGPPTTPDTDCNSLSRQEFNEAMNLLTNKIAKLTIAIGIAIAISLLGPLVLTLVRVFCTHKACQQDSGVDTDDQRNSGTELQDMGPKSGDYHLPCTSPLYLILEGQYILDQLKNRTTVSGDLHISSLPSLHQDKVVQWVLLSNQESAQPLAAHSINFARRSGSSYLSIEDGSSDQ